jgi:hypothetical protein
MIVPALYLGAQSMGLMSIVMKAIRMYGMISATRMKMIRDLVFMVMVLIFQN